jgi:hypothetical protein
MTPLAIHHVVSGPEALAKFRQGLTGEAVFGLLDQYGGRVLISLPVGVGKTDLLIKVIAHARTIDRRHDLVLVLVPRRDILDEILRKLPPDLNYIVLKPRPRSRCGTLDAGWIEYETTGCGLLAREELCRGCPRHAGCPWPDQYTTGRLKGTGLVFGTQQHIVNNPRFVDQIRDLTRAERVLTLIDESSLLIKGARRTIGHGDLQRFNQAQELLLTQTESPNSTQLEWIKLSKLVAEANTIDLRQGRWRFPWVDGVWATRIQRTGREIYGSSFRFVAFDLRHFARSDLLSRERGANGDIGFASLPDLGDNFVVFSGSMAKDLARYRLDPDHRRPGLVSLFQGLRFEHPGTEWSNISSIAGATKFFPRNAETILDFFVEMVARNIRDGKRTLLVAKKKFAGTCAAYLERRLRKLGAGPVQVVVGNWDKVVLDDPRILPLITYGIAGVNLFEDFDCAYCLTGFYINEATVAAVVHDLDATEDRFPIRIQTLGHPPRRVARVDLPDDRETILPHIAQWVLDQKEGDVVVQAVGRVRPFTKPREIITFQYGALPDVRYTREFRSIAQARSYFGITTRRQSEAESRASKARHLKTLGLSSSGIAEELRVSLSSIKRYLRSS